MRPTWRPLSKADAFVGAGDHVLRLAWWLVLNLSRALCPSGGSSARQDIRLSRLRLDTRQNPSDTRPGLYVPMTNDSAWKFPYDNRIFEIPPDERQSPVGIAVYDLTSGEGAGRTETHRLGFGLLRSRKACLAKAVDHVRMIVGTKFEQLADRKSHQDTKSFAELRQRIVHHGVRLIHLPRLAKSSD